MFQIELFRKNKDGFLVTYLFIEYKDMYFHRKFVPLRSSFKTTR